VSQWCALHGQGSASQPAVAGAWCGMALAESAAKRGGAGRRRRCRGGGTE